MLKRVLIDYTTRQFKNEVIVSINNSHVRSLVRPLPSRFEYYHVLKCNFSDRALGYSPMAPASYNMLNPDSKQIPTEKDVEIAGNIFVTQSSKREKLGELRVEALANNLLTLDDAATAEEKLDLWLIDGISAICKNTDTCRVTTSGENVTEEILILNTLVEYCRDKSTSLTELDKDQWNSFLHDLDIEIDQCLLLVPPEQCFYGIRDFLDTSTPTIRDDEMYLLDKIDNEQSIDNVTTNISFEKATVRNRLLQTKALLSDLKDEWKKITQITDQDIDRAAVHGKTIDATTTLPTNKLLSLLESYLIGNCTDRFDALWNLLDKDNDGLLDEVEVVAVAEIAISTTGSALLSILKEVINVSPAKSLDDIRTYDPTSTTNTNRTRKEAGQMKSLLKIFRTTTLTSHFSYELELSHRLRCSYSWANKEHQKNRIESVLIDETGWTGRKRYVELKPKVSLAEFREVQVEHMKFLDTISVEYLKSYREELLLMQGKNRQSTELNRDCFLFMAGICLIDYIVWLS